MSTPYYSDSPSDNQTDPGQNVNSVLKKQLNDIAKDVAKMKAPTKKIKKKKSSKAHANSEMRTVQSSDDETPIEPAIGTALRKGAVDTTVLGPAGPVTRRRGTLPSKGTTGSRYDAEESVLHDEFSQQARHMQSNAMQRSPTNEDFMALMTNLNEQLRLIHGRFDNLEHNLKSMGEAMKVKDRKIDELFLEVSRLKHKNEKLSSRLAWVDHKENANLAILTGRLDFLEPQPPLQGELRSESATTDGEHVPAISDRPDGQPETGVAGATDPSLQSQDVRTEATARPEHVATGTAAENDRFTWAVKRKLQQLTGIPTTQLNLTATPFHGKALIDFADRKLRRELFQCFRSNKPFSYFLNEFTSSRVNKLLYDVKKINRDKKIFHSAYTFNGRVFIKFSQESRGMPIDDLDDLEDMVDIGNG